MNPQSRRERGRPGVGRRLVWWVFTLICCFSLSRADAQIVFLPSWHQFSVQTSVMVPDQGSAALGSAVGRRTGRTSRGIPGFPAVGTHRGAGHRASSGRVHVTVIDLAAWDAAILASRRDGLAALPDERRATRAHRRAVARSEADRAGDLSLAEIRRLRASRENRATPARSATVGHAGRQRSAR